MITCWQAVIRRQTENDGDKQTVATRGGNRHSLRPDVFVLFIHQLCPHDNDKLVDDKGNKEDSKDVNPSKSVQHGCLRMRRNNKDNTRL